MLILATIVVQISRLINNKTLQVLTQNIRTDGVVIPMNRSRLVAITSRVGGDFIMWQSNTIGRASQLDVRSIEQDGGSKYV